MSIVMQLQDVAESTRLGPLSGEVRAGEILHLVGPNGAGKSTLLARMAGMTSGKGSIQFAGQPLEAWSATKLALHRAYLSQQQTPPFAMPVWHYLTLHQHDKTRTELLNDVAGRWLLMTNSDGAPINFPAVNGNAYVLLRWCCKSHHKPIPQANCCFLMSR